MIITNGAIHFYAVPIISFCDIPLSQVTEHLKKYGNYGIGITKEFAIKHGFNPVLYLENLSAVNEGIFKIHRYVLSNYESMLDDEGFQNCNIGLLQVLQIIKNHTGILDRPGRQTGKYEFYKEKEWRFTPILTDEKQMYTSDELDILEEKYPSKPHITSICLPLSFEDVSYILVESDTDIPILVTALNEATNLYKDDDQLKILLTKIFTADQIKDDF